MPHNRAEGMDRVRIPAFRGGMLDDRSDNMDRRNEVGVEGKDDDERVVLYGMLDSRLFHSKKVVSKNAPYEEARQVFDYPT
jgi:hypothetical protein